MSYGRICPILSISGYLDCKKDKCQLWLDEPEECAIQHTATALDRIADGVAYSPSTEVPSISECTAMVSAALARIADSLEADE